METEFTCCQCSVIKTRYISNKNNIKLPRFCSYKCKAKWQSINLTGSSSPNFGKKWNDEAKLRQQDLIKSKITDNYRYLAGSANRGKKFTIDRINKMHQHRSRESYVRHHDNDTRDKIGKKNQD